MVCLIPEPSLCLHRCSRMVATSSRVEGGSQQAVCAFLYIPQKFLLVFILWPASRRLNFSVNPRTDPFGLAKRASKKGINL